MRIIVDAMGGDNAPESAVWGGALAAKEYGEEVLLVGKPEVVANVLKEKGLSDVKGQCLLAARRVRMTSTGVKRSAYISSATGILP